MSKKIKTSPAKTEVDTPVESSRAVGETPKRGTEVNVFRMALQEKRNRIAEAQKAKQVQIDKKENVKK